MLDGELVVTVDGAETVLGWLDSVHLAKGELRSIHNRTDRQALLLVTVAHPVARWRDELHRRRCRAKRC